MLVSSFNLLQSFKYTPYLFYNKRCKSEINSCCIWTPSSAYSAMSIQSLKSLAIRWSLIPYPPMARRNMANFFWPWRWCRVWSLGIHLSHQIGVFGGLYFQLLKSPVHRGLSTWTSIGSSAACRRRAPTSRYPWGCPWCWCRPSWALLRGWSIGWIRC